MTKKTENLRSTKELRKKMAFLHDHIRKLDEEKAEIKKTLSEGIAQDAKRDPEKIKRIAEIDAEIEVTKPAIDILWKEHMRSEKVEKIAAAERLPDEMMKVFDDKILPQLRELLKNRFEWRKTATVDYLSGVNSHALIEDNDPLKHCVRVGLSDMVKSIERIIETSGKPIPKQAAPEIIDPEPSPKFGKNAKVSRTGAPVERIDGTSDTGGAPGQEESRHGLGIREIQIPGPRY